MHINFLGSSSARLITGIRTSWKRFAASQARAWTRSLTPLGGPHLWHSREALRPGGKVVGYGNTTSLRGEGLGSDRKGRRNRLHGIPIYALYIAGGWLLPGRKRIVPYSIQTLKRLKPALFRQDLVALLDLLQQKRIKPLIAHRLPLAEARHAQELLGKGGVTGKIVLMPNGSS